MTGLLVHLPPDEHSPTQKFTGKATIIGPKWTHMPTLTIGLLGVQIFWSVEMGYASPYLLSLGLSKSSMAIVFLAGPLSGLIIQPVIGILADTTTSQFGRRRPWMMLGTCICVLAMVLLGYTRGFAAFFTGWNTPSNDSLTIVLAVLSIYLIDFSINAVMAMDRALLVDSLPSIAQASGNAWAARMLGLGSVVGFFVGSIPLPALLPFLGKTQLEILSFVASLVLLLGHVITAVCVKERILLKNIDQTSTATRKSNIVMREVRQIWSNIRTLPSVIRQICVIQFFAWVSWFPLLFYTTLYIGDLYKRATPLSSNPDLQELHTRDAEATRLGTRALFFSAVLSLFVNLVFPACVATPASRRQARHGSIKDKWWRRMRLPDRFKINLVSLWAISHLVIAGCMLCTFFIHSVGGATFLICITGFSWAITQWAPFSLLGEAIHTTPDSTSHRVSILLTDTRTPSRIEEGTETDMFLEHHGDEDGDGETHQHPNHDNGPGDESNVRVEEEWGRDTRATQTFILGNPDARVSQLHVVESGVSGHLGRERASSHEEGGTGLSANAGVILGIHNVSIVLPQFLVTGISAVIFAVFDPVRPQPSVIPPPPQPLPPTPTSSSIGENEPAGAIVRMTGSVLRGVGGVMMKDVTESNKGVALEDIQSSSVVYIFRLGGIAALIAFVLSWRLARQLRN